MLKTIIETRGNQFLKKSIFLLVEPIFFDFLARRSSFPYRGKVFFNECFISGNGNGFSGQYKPFFIFFSKTPARESFFSVQWKRIFELTLHYGYWRRIFLSNEDRYFTRKFFPTSFIFPSSGNVFLNAFWLMETHFLASANAFFYLFFRYFCQKQFFFSSSGNVILKRIHHSGQWKRIF